MAINLRRSVLLDTTVLLRGFWPEHFSGDPRTTACATLVQRLIVDRAQILISAVSEAEFKIGDGARELPLYSGIEVVPFDSLAARALSAMVDKELLRQIQAQNGSTRPAVRYDLQIVACAVRHKATLIVTLDEPLRKTVARLGAAGKIAIDAVEPSALLVEPEPEPPPPSDASDKGTVRFSWLPPDTEARGGQTSLFSLIAPAAQSDQVGAVDRGASSLIALSASSEIGDDGSVEPRAPLVQGASDEPR